MQKTFFFIFVLASTLLVYSQSRDKADLIRRLDQYNAQTLVKRDTAALKQYLAGDFLLNPPSNKISFGSGPVISAMREGRTFYVRFEVTTDTVYFINRKIAVSMGGETAVFGSEGPLKGVELKRRYTNIWIKDKKKWKLKARHSNLICNK